MALLPALAMHCLCLQFFRVVALPMFETFAAVFPGTKTMLLYVNENYAR